MPKRKHPRKPVRRSAGRQGRASRKPDLMESVSAALVLDLPLPLLELTSALLAAVDPRRNRGLRHAEPSGPTQQDLITSFLGVELPQTSALLLVVAALLPDDVERRRLRRAVLARNHPLPQWLLSLDDTRPTTAARMSHVLGDGDNVMVGVRMSDGSEVSVVVYIDHNFGTLVKDAFVIPAPIEEAVDLFRQAADDPDTTVAELSLADARARIEPAIELGAITVPPLETDTWPGCRALVEWVLRMLPADGTGYVRPEWDEAALAELADRFFASPYGAALDDEDRRSLLESLLWFGTDYGPGDPLRWSPTAVEILLLDWLPRKIVAEAEYLAKAPELLRGFVRFCHAERGIRPELTAETEQAIDEDEPDYQEVIRSPRPQGPEALIAAMLEYEEGQR